MKSTGYIINGKYYPADKNDEQGSRVPAVQLDNITYRAYDHDRQREEHRRDLIQPYKNGAPNPEFVEQYPEEAQNYGFRKETS